MEIKSAKELSIQTPSRQMLLEKCIQETTLGFYKQMEKVSQSGFTSHVDELLAYFTINVKRDEYETVIPAIIKNFESLGYAVTQPYKNKQKQFEGSDTVISVSWDVK
jgi:hypothetical protein